MKNGTPKALLPDHPIYLQAMEALKRYYDAQDASAPAAELERLRLQAEELFQAVTDVHFDSTGYQPISRH